MAFNVTQHNQNFVIYLKKTIFLPIYRPYAAQASQNFITFSDNHKNAYTKKEHIQIILFSQNI